MMLVTLITGIACCVVLAVLRGARMVVRARQRRQWRDAVRARRVLDAEEQAQALALARITACRRDLNTLRNMLAGYCEAAGESPPEGLRVTAPMPVVRLATRDGRLVGDEARDSA